MDGSDDWPRIELPTAKLLSAASVDNRKLPLFFTFHVRVHETLLRVGFAGPHPRSRRFGVGRRMVVVVPDRRRTSDVVAEPPHVVVRCRRNCADRVDAALDLELEAVCLDCPPTPPTPPVTQRLVYAWEFSPACAVHSTVKTIVWRVNTSTSRDERQLVVLGGTFAGADEESYQFVLSGKSI